MNDRLVTERPFTFWHLAPEDVEGACGFFLRMVAVEGLPSARTYADAIGVTTTNLLAQDFLDALLKLPLPDDAKASLRRWTPRLEGDFYHLSGSRLRQGQMSTTKRRFCRGCLADHAFHRAWWDIVSVRKCPLHGCELEHTFEDGRRLPWWWPEFTIAPDGRPLGRAMPRVDGRHMFEHFVLRRLGVIDDYVANPLLEGAELHDVIMMSGHLGRFFESDWSWETPDMSSFEYPHQTGFEALSGTADGLVKKFIEWLERNRNAAEGRGLDKGFGWIRRGSWMTRMKGKWDSVNYAQRQAYASTFRMSRATGGTERLTFKYDTLVDVARRYDVRADYLRKFLGAIQKLPSDFYFTTEQSDEIGILIDQLLTPTEAAKLLGCKPSHMTSLVRWQLLPGYTGLKQNYRHRFRREDVARLAETLARIEPTAREGPQRTLWNYCKEAKVAIGEAMRQVLVGELVPTSFRSNAVGFNAVRVSGARRMFRTITGEDELTFTKAAALLGLSSEKTKSLADAGILDTDPEGKRLLAASVKKFQQRYVNASTYRQELGCGSIVMKALKRIGVEPVFEEVPGRGDHIVERGEFFRLSGIKETAPHLAERWRAFVRICAEICPLFLFPDVIGHRPQTFYNSTRVVRFTVSIEEDEIVVRKTFNARASREWRCFLGHRPEIYRMLAVMRLRKSSASSDVEGSTIIRDEASMTALATAIAELHWLMARLKARKQAPKAKKQRA
ncbi:helix-turn-helix domain-containing protein [Rhizobium leguminosarum]|uniref:helix-turn-helix domain-containing protein n=1 Tax=Rhizobium leguminosarum TaxID=384 RepID=UPI0013BD331E|nr:helix-turn-helix domain-containing protein [Rhizobium leguminosarum]NEI62185.1 hypothetical protein [Rhizobium leguminosarum]